MSRRTRVVLIDLDNTVYDWVAFFVPSMVAMIDELCAELDADHDRLLGELRSVFRKHRSVEYPFCLQALPSVAGLPLGHRNDVVERGHRAFSAARDKHLVSYPGVHEALQELSAAGMCLIATTNAPMYQATRRIQRLGIARWFNAVAARRSFAVPAEAYAPPLVPLRRSAAATPLGQSWEFEVRDLKPSDRMYRIALEETNTAPAQALAVGDHLVNDVAPALRIGARGAWARYGQTVDHGLWQTLLTVTPWGSAKVAAQRAQPTSNVPVLDGFSELLNLV